MACSYSVDALDEEEWWLPVEERETKRKRGADEKEDDIKKSKTNKRRKISEILRTTQSESTATLHTTGRQFNELMTALQPQLDKLTTVEAQTISQLTKKDFVRYKPTVVSDEKTVGVHLDPYLTAVSPSLGISVERRGHGSPPLVIALTSSAERASELKRQATIFCKDHNSIAKLCAKHSKISDQVSYLSSHDVIIVVATPNRLHKLISNGALKLDKVKLLVLDWYWRDKKLKQIQDIPEIWRDFTLLYIEHINDIINTKQCKIGLL